MHILRLKQFAGKLSRSGLSRDTLWVAGVQAILALFGLLLTLVLTRSLGQESFGVYQYMITAFNMLLVLSLPGMRLSVVRSLARGEKINIPSLLLRQVKYGLVAMGVALGIAAYYLWAGNNELAGLFAILAAVIPLVDSLQMYAGVYRGMQEFQQLAYNQAVVRSVEVLLAVFAAYLTGNIIVVFGVYVLAQLIMRYGATWLAMRGLGERSQSTDSEAKDYTRETFLYGRNLSVSQIATVVGGQLDKLLLWHIFGPIVLATYAVALVVPSAVYRAADVVNQVALPRMSRTDWFASKNKRRFVKVLGMYVGVSGLVCLLYILTVPFWFPVLFPQYGHAIVPAQILGMLIVLVPIRLILEQVFVAARKGRDIFWVRFLEVALYVVIFFLLLWGLGDPLYVVALALPLKVFTTIIMQLVRFYAWGTEKKIVPKK